MRRPSVAGKRNAGLSLKRGIEGRQDYLVCGPLGLLAFAYGSTHLCPHRPDTHPARDAISRPFVGNQRYQPGRQALTMMERERAFNSQDVVRFLRWTCVGSVDCLRLRTVRGKENIATNEPDLPTGVSPRSCPAG